MFKVFKPEIKFEDLGERRFKVWHTDLWINVNKVDSKKRKNYTDNIQKAPPMVE